MLWRRRKAAAQLRHHPAPRLSATRPKRCIRSRSYGGTWSGSAGCSRCRRMSGRHRLRARRRHGGAGPSRRRGPRPTPCGRRAAASARAAALLVEPAAREHGPRRRDRLELAARPLHHLGPEPEPAHPPLGAALEPQALPVTVMGDVVGPEGGVALLRPGLQPGHVVADELAAVLVVADEALVAVDVLVQPDGVEVVASE